MAEGVSSAHGRKFGLAYLALAALLGAAAGTFVLLIERGPPPPPPPWSTWRPRGDSVLARARQIAAHVAPKYHLPSGKQLVRVNVATPAAGKQAIQAFAVPRIPRPASVNDYDTLDASNALMYSLCGTGDKCSIKEGKPSIERGAVLRREALELALYTFRYVPGVDSVVTFFPPRTSTAPLYALFFRKDDLDDQLDEPLRTTLPQPVPPIPGEAKLSRAEQEAVDDLTTARFFRYQVQTAQGGERVLVFAPPV